MILQSFDILASGNMVLPGFSIVPISRKYCSDVIDIVPIKVYTIQEERCEKMYLSVREASEKWGISDRSVRALCSHGKTQGMVEIWFYPIGITEKG